jgi:Flp pilus assembly protein TadG
MRFRSVLGVFRVERGGNVAITFALAILPIIAGVGFAVDYSRANAVKVALQQALDATALMQSKEAATDTSDQLQTNAQKYFAAQFARAEAKYGATDVTVTTSILGVIGYDNIAVGSTTSVKWGTNRLRVALLLDNTGSMAQSGKMPALQAATKSLLTQLQNAASTDGDVYVSIIPFVKDVNLGASNWNSDYLYWDNAAKSDNSSWDAINGSCSAPFQNYSPRSSCISKASCSISGYYTQSSCTSAGTCSLSGYSTESGCTAAGTCSISGKTTESSCTTGSCSISGYST